MNNEQLNDLAKKLYDEKKFEEALHVLDIPNLPKELIPNLAKCHYYTGNPQKALELIENLPKDHELSIDYSLYNNYSGNYDKAFSILEKLQKNSSDPKVMFNLGWHFLRLGEFKLGFRHLEYGSKCRSWGNEYSYIEQGILDKSKRWNGKDKVEHLSVIMEGGLGDEIIFFRWITHLSEFCNDMVVYCNKNLMRLFINSSYDNITFRPIQLLTGKGIDKYCPSMSIPSICETINSPMDHVIFPYLNGDFNDRYYGKLFNSYSNGLPVVGVKWQGNQQFEHDQMRSVPKNDIINYATRNGEIPFSLQLEDRDNNILNLNQLLSSNDWYDTATVISNLDKVVSTCTSIPHLCGAMNHSVEVVIPNVPYFIWANKDMPWYLESVKLLNKKDIL
jgi:tetratricopeptide (TPR) repeat protein